MKRMFKGLGALALLVGLVSTVRAANTCTPSDIDCFVSGPSQNTTTRFRIDSSGNIQTVGSITSTGNIGTSAGLFNLGSFTVAQTTNTISTSTGTLVFVTNGVAVNSGKGEICMSTGTTTTNQWIVYPSSLTAITVCQ